MLCIMKMIVVNAFSYNTSLNQIFRQCTWCKSKPLALLAGHIHHLADEKDNVYASRGDVYRVHLKALNECSSSHLRNVNFPFTMIIKQLSDVWDIVIFTVLGLGLFVLWTWRKCFKKGTFVNGGIKNVAANILLISQPIPSVKLKPSERNISLKSKVPLIVSSHEQIILEKVNNLCALSRTNAVGGNK
jgi:hypothetical protein